MHQRLMENKSNIDYEGENIKNNYKINIAQKEIYVDLPSVSLVCL